MPISNSQIQSLDAILIKFNPIFYQAKALLDSEALGLDAEISQVLEDAIRLEQEFATWAAGQPEEWRSRTIGRCRSRMSENGYCYAGSVDVYYDRMSHHIRCPFRQYVNLCSQFILQRYGILTARRIY